MLKSHKRRVSAREDMDDFRWWYEDTRMSRDTVRHGQWLHNFDGDEEGGDEQESAEAKIPTYAPAPQTV